MAVRSEQVSRNDGAVGRNPGARLFPFTFKNEMKRNKKSGEKLSKKRLLLPQHVSLLTHPGRQISDLQTHSMGLFFLFHFLRLFLQAAGCLK